MKSCFIHLSISQRNLNKNYNFENIQIKLSLPWNDHTVSLPKKSVKKLYASKNIQNLFSSSIFLDLYWTDILFRIKCEQHV